MVQQYFTVSLPKDLVDQIDYYISEENKSYSSRSEFVKEAARVHLLRLKELKKKEE